MNILIPTTPLPPLVGSVILSLLTRSSTLAKGRRWSSVWLLHKLGEIINMSHFENMTIIAVSFNFLPVSVKARLHNWSCIPKKKKKESQEIMSGTCFKIMGGGPGEWRWAKTVKLVTGTGLHYPISILSPYYMCWKLSTITWYRLNSLLKVPGEDREAARKPTGVLHVVETAMQCDCPPGEAEYENNQFLNRSLNT